MMMPTRAMHVTVAHFFIRRVSDEDHLNIEGQGLTGEGMVGVEHHLLPFYPDHGYDLNPGSRLGLKLHIGLDFVNPLEEIPRFVTCMIDMLYPETGLSVVEILEHLGLTVDHFFIRPRRDG